MIMWNLILCISWWGSWSWSYMVVGFTTTHAISAYHH